jgi:N-acetylglutamate synthase-like GNAT family acetyltransferase
MRGSSFVRLAVESDLSQISSHREASRVESAQYRGQTRDLHQNGVELSLVAGYGDTVMASLTARIVSTVAVINHVYVVPDSREVGLGDSLLQRLMSDLRSQGIQKIEGQALPGDRSMKNLFERHGLIAQTIIVGKTL